METNEYAVTICRTMKIVDTIIVEAQSKEQAEAIVADGIKNKNCPEIEATDWISIVDQLGPFYGEYKMLDIAKA